MSQKNETTVLVLALLITVGLVGGGLLWFSKNSGLGGFIGSRPNNLTPGNNSSPTPSSTPGQSNPGNSFERVQKVPSGLFSYGGSTTWAPIRRELDPAIQAAQPNFRLRYTNPTTGAPGSGSGIKMLLSDQLAFSHSSRSIKDEEYQQAKVRGFTLQEIPVAIDGIAIGVNPSLNIPGMTVSQLRDIYTGALTNWSQLGGPNLPITPYSRRVEDSGTVEFFVENVLKGQKFGANVQFIPTTTQALRQVTANPGVIYYASAPELVPQCGVKPLPIGEKADELVPPYQTPFIPLSQCPGQRNQLNAAAFQSGQYPITRKLFVIVKQNGQNEQQAGEAYANLALTPQGQDLIKKAGFVSIR